MMQGKTTRHAFGRDALDGEEILKKVNKRVRRRPNMS